MASSDTPKREELSEVMYKMPYSKLAPLARDVVDRTADWHEQEIAEAREKSREKWQSLCGCPMCEHHSEAYRLEALRTKDK